jgi:cell division protein FtsB
VDQAKPEPGRARPSLTARAIALAVVVLVLTISYATSLRIYFSQVHEIASTKAEIADRQTRIGELQGQLNRWNDLGYVRTQARDRLGWVVPGETGYRVVGSDGQPLGGGAEISGETAPPAPPKDAWWAEAWGGIQAADQPAPVKPKAKAPKPITTDTRPKAPTSTATSR